MPLREVIFGKSGNPVESFARRYSRFPLYQSGELSPAGIISDPESLDPDQVEQMRLMGRAITEKYRDMSMQMLAYTQIRPDVFTHFGVDQSLRNAIYLSHRVGQKDKSLFVYQDRSPILLSGSLLINPELTVADDQDRFTRLEACGSINYGKLWMYASRPMNVVVKAFVYNPELGAFKPVIIDHIESKAAGGGVIHHEIDHLLGFDASDSPNTLINDPFSIESPMWEGYPEDEWAHEIGKIMAHHGMNFLVKRDGKLVIVNNKGEESKDFQRVGSKVAV